MNTQRLASSLAMLLLAAPAFAQNARFPLVMPIGGTPYQDWTIVNYVDLNPGPDFVDYRGGTYTYNGHNAIDFTLANHAAMDAGVPVFAAAAGTVLFVHDGEYDRCSRATVCGDFPNYVTIEHVGGIVTEYVHLKRGSVSVEVGQPVIAGQQIGLVGSSGLSSDAHLHFAVFENWIPVETYQDLSRWWDNPLPYSGDVLGALDHGISHFWPSIDQFVDRPAKYDVFQQSDGAGQQAFFWTLLHGVNAGDSLDFYFYRPNGTLYEHHHWNATQQLHYDWWTANTTTLPAVPDLGVWRAEMRVNGTLLASDTFTVVASAPTKTWNALSGNWSTGGNWTAAGAPGANSNVKIVSNDGQARTVSYDVAAPTLKSLWVDLTGAGNNHATFQMSAHELALVDGFIVGRSGRGTFNQSGGRVTTADPSLDSIVGHNAGSEGVYNLSGNGTLAVARDLYIGTLASSKGTFNQSGGANTVASRLILGSAAGATGTYNLSGGTLSAYDHVLVGNSGTGTLNVTNGALVATHEGGIVGFAAGSSGAVVVDGPGSIWVNPAGFAILAIGVSGNGSMAVTGGGKVSNVGAVIGQQAVAGASGSVMVSGSNSRWQMTAGLAVGEFGTGSLNIQNGGRVESVGGVVGLQAGSEGMVTVSGPGSAWINTGSLHVGSIGDGFVVVNNGGELRADAEILINRFAAGDGAMLVTGAGSKVSTNGELRVADEGIGSLKIVEGATVTSLRGFLARNAATADATASVSGAGSKWMLGESLTVGGAGFGRLVVENGGVVAAPGGVTVAARGTVDGDGTIAANVSNAGTILPGLHVEEPGTLHITGNYTQLASGALKAALASPASYATLDVSGNLSLNGTLSVATVDFNPLGGQSFDLLDWGGTLNGTFSTIQLPTLGAGLAWDTSQLYTTGVISVLGPPPIAGDFSGSGMVENADLTLLLNHWGAAIPPLPAGWNGSPPTAPAVDNDELTALLNHWGRSAGAASVAAMPVPEPGTHLILLTALAALSHCRPPRSFHKSGSGSFFVGRAQRMQVTLNDEKCA